MNLKKPIPHPVRYHLRATLTPAHHRAEERALWAILRKARIDEVMFFVPHAEERSPGLGTDVENEGVVRLLRPVFGRLRKAGIAPSINIWWTMGFSHFSGMQRDLRDRFDFRWAVNPEGRVSCAVACPADPAWLGQVERMYATYAALKPDNLWIDDDVHPVLRADMHSACFCDTCLAEMERRTGQHRERMALLQAILADPPNPVRDAWLAYQGDLDLAIMTRLARAVHAVSPATRVSLMHSLIELHAAEGRRWPELIAALGPPVPLTRPGLGCYNEGTAFAVAEGLVSARHAQAIVPAGIEQVPEIENYPHSRFAKSCRLVRAQMTLAQLAGMSGITFSIYRFGGRLDLERRRDRSWENLLAETKPMLQALADLAITYRQQRGIYLAPHPDGARHARSVGEMSRTQLMLRVRTWDAVLPLLGFPVTYAPEAATVTALAGEQVLCLSPEERQALFSRGVLLDSRAVECLLSMGEGYWVGAVGKRAPVPAVQEILTDPRFGGLAGDVINIRWESVPQQFEWDPAARSISNLIDYNGQTVGPGVVLFENAAGGRVAVFPYDGQIPSTASIGMQYRPYLSPGFISGPRQAQMGDLVRWLSRNEFPVAIPKAPAIYPFWVDQGHRGILGMTNLSPDPAPSLEILLRPPAFPVKRWRRLDAGGNWRTMANPVKRVQRGTWVLEAAGELEFLQSAVWILES